MASIGREEATAPSIASTAEAGADSARAARAGTGQRWEAEELSSGPAPTTRPEQLDDFTKLKMRAYRNFRYHSDRQSHYERLTRSTNFVVVLVGSASFAAAFANSPAITALGAALVTIIASAQLVFDFSRRAKDEDVLKFECAKLLADAEDPEAKAFKIEAAMVTMYGRELETYHAVNAIAYNETQLAFGRPHSTLLKIGWWRKLFRHWLVYTAADFDDVAASSG